MHGLELVPLAEMLARVDRALAASPADHTAISWLESGHAEAAAGDRRQSLAPARARSVVVRVTERGRVGFHRTDAAEPGELEWAVRLALGQALADPPRAAGPARPGDRPTAHAAAGPPPGAAWDGDLARLAPDAAARLLGQGLGPGEAARLAWSETRLAAGETGGPSRGFATTAAELSLTCSEGPGAGWAAAAARSLAGLAPAEVLERARRRRSGEPVEGTPPPAIPVVVGAEAAGALVAGLARWLAAAADHRPLALDSRLDPRLDLADDPGHAAALPFPSDLFGHPLARRLILRGGVAVDPVPAPPVGDEPPPLHLVLAPGPSTESDLLAATGEGLFVGRIDRLDPLEAGGSAFRARVAGSRWIRGGRLGPPAGDLVWEDRLDRLFAVLSGLGSRLVALPSGAGSLGGVAAPALAFSEALGLRPTSSPPNPPPDAPS